MVVYSKKRSFESYESFSQKAKDALKANSCINASSILEEKFERSFNWTNDRNKINHEFLVSRYELDNALIEDLQNHDIKILNNQKISYLKIDEKIEIEIENKIYKYDYLVDTRGRFTPFKSEYFTGPKTVSLLVEYEFEKYIKNNISIHSCTNGWIWQAKVDDKKGYVQYSCDEKEAKEIENVNDLIKVLNKEKVDLWVDRNAKPKKTLVKRDSFYKIHKTIIDEKMILVGDSAISIDPVSGNGALLALSMATYAPEIINTILTNENKKEEAINLYKEKVKSFFEKYSKIGKEFYNLEQRFQTPFWIKRQRWQIQKD